MQIVYRFLSFTFLSSVISVSAQATTVSTADVTTAMGITTPPPSHNPICDEYPIDSDKGVFCRSYPKDKVVQHPTLPALKDLKEDTLYLITQGDIEAPYALKNGVGILPPPHSPDVTLIPSGSGTDSDHGLCVMKFAEGTKVAGVTVDLRSSSWKPTPGKNTDRAIFCGSTASSRFSESTIYGREDFVDLVHQYKTTSKGTMQTYHRLNLYAKGSQNLIRVENADMSRLVEKASRSERHVDISDCTGTLSGNVPSSTEQAGFVINNLVPQLFNTSVFYEPLAESEHFLRAGLIAIDTPAFYIFSVHHLQTSPTQEDDSRAMDFKEVYRNKLLHSEMKIISTDNRYYALEDQQDHYKNELDSAELLYLKHNNEEYESTDDVDNSPEGIRNLSNHGGVFKGNAMQLEAMCPVNPDNYNATNPLPTANGIPITEGPANATVMNFVDYCMENEDSDECSIKNRLIDGAIGGGIMTVVSSGFWLSVIGCICYSHRKTARSGYGVLENHANN